MAIKTVQAIINGQTHTLTLNAATGKYEATITAPEKSSYPLEGHYYGVVVKATDDAGNITTIDDKHQTLGSALQLRVKEKNPPTITIISPTESSRITNNKPKITWNVVDDDAGVNPDTIGITIDSSSKITGSSVVKTKIDNGYSCSYTPSIALTDGNHTIKVDASDYDGNAATQKKVSFTVDTIAPTLSVTSPEEGMITNSNSVVVSGKTNDATSSPVTVLIKINGQSETNVTVNSDGSFSKTITIPSGVNTITIIATDAAGKSTTVNRTVVLDTGAPVFQSVTITPNPVDAGNTYIISVEVTD